MSARARAPERAGDARSRRLGPSSFARLAAAGLPARRGRAASSAMSACRRWRVPRRWSRRSATFSAVALRARARTNAAGSGSQRRLDRVQVDARSHRNPRPAQRKRFARRRPPPGSRGSWSIADRPSTATISVAFGCPFEGEVDPGVVADLAERLVVAGAGELVLADTIGVATPRPVDASSSGHRSRGSHWRPLPRHAPHGRRQRLGVGRGGGDRARRVGRRPRRVSVRAARDGNVATEDVLYFLEREARRDGRRPRGPDRRGDRRWRELLGRELPGRVYRAGLFPAT